MAGYENPIIQQGANVTELAALFGLDRKNVRERLEGIAPIGRRVNNDVWRVRDVASRLINLGDDDAELVSTVLAMNHTQLPKMLSKEFWLGQSHRIKVLREIGDLWDTAAVVTLASEVFKTLRLSLSLASDSIERRTGLTVEQRELIDDLMTEALNDCREKLVVNLTERREHSEGKAFASTQAPNGNGSGRAGGADPLAWNAIEDQTGL